MNGHDIKTLNKVPRCSRCGVAFRTDFVSDDVPGTPEEYEACSPEQREAYARAAKCHECAAALDKMEYHDGYDWKVCPDCGAAHRLIASGGPGPGSP